jgi:hypothetical protein
MTSEKIEKQRNDGIFAKKYILMEDMDFDVHHSGKDVVETVNPRELELGAIALALFAYVLSEEGV